MSHIRRKFLIQTPYKFVELNNIIWCYAESITTIEYFILNAKNFGRTNFYFLIQSGH